MAGIQYSYSGEEFVDMLDTTSGRAENLREHTDVYIDDLGHYIQGEQDIHQLEHSIENVEESLELLFESIASLDQLVSEENMRAHVIIDGDRGISDLRENTSTVSNGVFSELEEFNDLVTLMHYIEEHEVEIECDQKHMNSKEIETGSPTRMVYESENILELDEKIRFQTRRIAYAEKLAREHLETDRYGVYDPEPPLFNMQGHRDYSKKVDNLLQRPFKKAVGRHG